MLLHEEDLIDELKRLLRQIDYQPDEISQLLDSLTQRQTEYMFRVLDRLEGLTSKEELRKTVGLIQQEKNV